MEAPTTVESDDDEDSGNDEPPYNAAAANAGHNHNAHAPAQAVGDEDENMGDVDEDEVPEDIIEANVMAQDDADVVVPLPIARPRPIAPRNALHYVGLLSNPRPNDRNNAPQIDALATESEWVSTELTDCSFNRFPLFLLVLLVIFSYLDDLSLASVSRVCRRWKSIVQKYTTDEMWCAYTKKRWPLIQAIARVPNWLEMFATLMDSCFCRTCLIDMAQKIPAEFDHNNYRKIKRLQNENDQITDGIDFVAIDDQLTHLSASIVGPPGSPYEGGKFFLYIVVPQFYPMFPPTVRFLTKIVHPNISRHGDVGIDIIQQHNWSLALTIPKILLSVQSLLTDPFTEVGGGYFVLNGFVD